MKNWLILALFAAHTLVFTLDVEAGLFKKRRRCRNKCVATCPAPCPSAYPTTYKYEYSFEFNQYFCTLSQSFSINEDLSTVDGTKTGNGMGDTPDEAKHQATMDLASKCSAPYCYLIPDTIVCDSCVDYFGTDCCNMSAPTLPYRMKSQNRCCPPARPRFYICQIAVRFCDGETVTITRGAKSRRVAYCRAYDAARKAACHHSGLRCVVPCGCKIIQP